MATPLRVLILEDKPEDAELMLHELRQAGFAPNWQRVEDEAGYLARLDPGLDIILADYSLPQFDALRALRLLKERDWGIPFVVVTGAVTEEVAVECMKEGASDYLLKDRLARLGQAVTHSLEQRRLRAEQHAALERLRLQGATLEAAEDAIVITDRDGRIVWANPAFTRLTGYAVAEAIGQNLRFLKSGRVDPAIYRTLWETILAGKAWRGELWNRRKDGTLYLEEQTITPVRNQQGTIAHFVAIKNDITVRKEAEEALAARTGQLEAIRAVSVEITRELDLTRLLQLIQHRVGELLEATGSVVFLWDAHQAVLVPQVWQDDSTRLSQFRLSLGEGVAGIVAERRQGIIVNEYRTSPYITPFLLAHTRHTAVVAEPLLYHDRLLGVIVVDNGDTDRRFSSDDQRLLRLFAAQAAIAIENARLYEATVRRAQQFDTLNSLGQALTMELDSKRAAGAILKAANLLVPGAVGQVWERVGDTDALQLVATTVLGPHTEAVTRRLRAGEGLIGLAVSSGRPVTSVDVTGDPRFVNREWAVDAGLVSAIAVPLVSRGVARGGLVLLTRETHHFSDDEMALLQLFAVQAAIAMENARLFGETEERRRAAEVLAELTHAVSASLDLDTVLQRVVDGATSICECDLAEIALWDEDASVLRFRYWAGIVSGDYTSLCIAPGQGIGGRVLETGQPFRTENYLEDSRISSDLAALARVEHVVAEVAVPIRLDSRVEGVLFVINRSPRPFTDRHEIILQRLADHAAIAVRNARQYQQIRDHAADLEARVEARTQELAQANDQLQAASRNKSEFLANMSHEIRTPLNSILGFAQVLEDQTKTTLTDKQRRYLANIYSSGQHLLQLINDILDLSKVEAGKVLLAPQPLPVALSINDLLVVARGLAHKKGQRIHAQIADDLPPLVADPVRFKQICFNLLSNAVKFTPEGGTVTVRARAVTTEEHVDGEGEAQGNVGAGKHGQYLEMAVIDTGVGIRPDDIPKLFREFTQLERTRVQQQEGTGLGLALTKRLVELHGGRIRADSAGEGQGSTFTVWLPFGGPVLQPE